MCTNNISRVLGGFKKFKLASWWARVELAGLFEN